MITLWYFPSYFPGIFVLELPLPGQYCCLLSDCLLSSYSFSQRHRNLHKIYPGSRFHPNLLCAHFWFGWQHKPVSKAEIAVILATFSSSSCQSSLKCGRTVTCPQLDPEMPKTSNPVCSKSWQPAQTRSVCVLQCWIFLLQGKCFTELKLFLISCFLLCLIYGWGEVKKQAQICCDRYPSSQIG